MDCSEIGSSVLGSFVLCPPNLVDKLYLRGGQPNLLFRVAPTTLSNIGAWGRHSWQSFGLAGGIVRALASVPLVPDSLAGKLILLLLHL